MPDEGFLKMCESCNSFHKFCNINRLRVLKFVLLKFIK